MPLEYSDPIDSVKGQAPEGDEGYSEPYEALKALQSMMMIFVINVFRRQGCPHLGQGHGPIVSSRQFINVIWFICKIYAWSIHPI